LIISDNHPPLYHKILYILTIIETNGFERSIHPKIQFSFDPLRDAIRFKHYYYDDGKTCIHWVKRHILYCLADRSSAPRQARRAERCCPLPAALSKRRRRRREKTLRRRVERVSEICSPAAPGFEIARENPTTCEMTMPIRDDG
jgi:hypothetical protein